MVLDMRLETVIDRAQAGDKSGETTFYKAANMGYAGAAAITAVDSDTSAAKVAYLETPCSYCTLKNECGPANAINP